MLWGCSSWAGCRRRRLPRGNSPSSSPRRWSCWPQPHTLLNRPARRPRMSTPASSVASSTPEAALPTGGPRRGPGRLPHSRCDEDLRRAHPRLPDECPRLRATGRPARDRGLRRREQPALRHASRRRRRRRVQHLRGARERRQQALRQPRPAAPRKDPQPGDADRRRRLHGAEGPRHHRPAGALGRRRLRHPQHRQPAGPARPRPPQPRGPGRDPRVARGVPLHPADPARLRLQRLGSRSRWAATTPARSASSPACGARRPTAARATSSPRSRPSSQQGVVEITLLGQNVNTYGVEFGDRLAFGKLLRACGEVDGLERVRFTSPHPPRSPTT